MKRLVGFLFLAACSLGAAQAQSIGGAYIVRGKNANGSGYGGEARIVLTSETTCEIFWKTGATTSRGICMRNGDAFSAGYALGNSIGLVIYKVNANGVLDGLWTIAGQKGVGSETLIPK